VSAQRLITVNDSLVAPTKPPLPIGTTVEGELAISARGATLVWRPRLAAAAPITPTAVLTVAAALPHPEAMVGLAAAGIVAGAPATACSLA